ncbi:MAG TPA: helix-turn-helix transcriptional regulator [Verrucomicrobiae bacterium]|nr:helix-turn-helix transcriptional regulator [Verrucomicrobiae bacterium]
MKGNSTSSLPGWLPSLYEAHTLDSLPMHLARFLSAVVPADAIAYNEVNIANGQMKVVANPPELNDSPRIKHLAAIIDEHPLVQHQQKTGDVSARKISDLLSRAGFHESAVYREVYRHIGCEDQMAFTLHATPETIAAMAMNRSRRSFTEEERASLNLLQPHLIQIYRNAELLTALQEKLAGVERMMHKLPVGLLLINARGRIKFATEHARRLMERFLQPAASSDCLPSVLSEWLSKTRVWNGHSLPNPTGHLCLEGPAGKLLVRSVREAGDDETMLVLEERPSERTAQSLRVLGLTARESEVLFWVTRGKTNHEVALILGSATRTVQKHLERIFSKLGVESRTAAAGRALEVLNG